MVLTKNLTLGELIAVTTSSAVLVPALGTTALLLSAVDVIHAVALPTVSLKADAIPARVATANIFPELVGNMRGQCSELCGALHGFMPLHVLAV